MKNYIVAAIFLLSLIAISCEKDPEKDPDNGDDNGVVDTTHNGTSHENQTDYIWDPSSEISIILNGNSITSNSPNVTINGSTAIITAEGNYNLTGNLQNGQVIVDAGATSLVRLILNNTSISNSSGPAILVEKSLKTIINLANGSNNIITDGPSYANPDDDPNAAIFSKSDITIYGGGKLSVDGNYKDGITGKDGLLITSGTIEVSAVDDGIRGKDYLIVKGGNIRVECGGDGFKADSEANTSVGYILIEGGEITAETGGDAIYAFNNITTTSGTFNLKTGGGSEFKADEISSKGFKGRVKVTLALHSCVIDAADHGIDSDNAIEVFSGDFEIATSKAGIHSDSTIVINDGDISITRATEGFESHAITFTNGDLNITSTDDCFSATDGYDVEFDDKSLVIISGGTIIMNPLRGDALDSNGSIEITSGTIIIHGPPLEPEVAIDYNGNFNITGGFVIASGTGSNMTKAPSSTSTQNGVLIKFPSIVPESTLFHIQDNDGNNIVTFEPGKQYQSIIFSSPNLVSGNTYNIYTSGTSTGDENNGLYQGGTYTPGNMITTFTVSNTITTVNI